MDSLLEKIFGLSPKSSSSQEKANLKDSKKKWRKSHGTQVDRSLRNARHIERPKSAASNRDSARSLLCYALNNEDLDRQSKHAKKYNKHNLFRVSSRAVSKEGERPGFGGFTTPVSCRPALLVISRQDPSLSDTSSGNYPDKKSFNKYIPVENFDSPLYRLSKLDRHFPLCWFDVQTWYRETRARRREKEGTCNRVGARSSVSDTSMSHTPPWRQNTNARGTDETLLCSSYNKTLHELSEDDRFGLDVNRTYCQVTSSKSPKYVIELLLQLPGRTDLSLCHLKTEMIVFCLQKFFFPVADIHVMWVQDLRSQAVRLCSSRGIQHLHAHPSTEDSTEEEGGMPFDNLQAVMVVSPDAAVLLKHSELCFLNTLTTVIDIHREKLILFQQTRKSNQLAVIREIS